MQVCPGMGHLVTLRKLLPDAEIVGAADVAIGGCTCDSRKVRGGELFAALVGNRRDGHDFIAEAAARGCAAVLTERPAPEIALPWCVVPNARQAYARACQALAGNPSRQLKLIGVTGSNGKMTTSCLIAGVLTAADYRVGVLGKLGCLDGRMVEQSTHGTPPPERLATLLARMLGNGCSHAVMEVSRHALDRSELAGACFDVACVTNVASNHSDHRAGPRGRGLPKARLFDHLADEGLAVLNADDPGSARYLRELGCPTLTVGIRAAAEITATPVEQCTSRQTFLLTAGTETVPVCAQMIGRQHVYNCLTAAAVGLAYGVELSTIVRGLESVGHVPGRLERIECGQPFGVFVDFARTPNALGRVLKTLREVTAGRLICVFGAGGQRDRRKRALMGRAVERGADVAVLTNDNPRHEDPRAIFHDILQGFKDARAATVIPDRVEAIGRALEIARPGDCVLLAGKGHENRQIIGGRRRPLDDCQVARAWLYEARNAYDQFSKADHN